MLFKIAGGYTILQAESSTQSLLPEITIDPASRKATHKFMERVMELPDGKNLLHCLQCGTCTGGCPHGDSMDFAPRKMISALRAGMIDNIVNSNTIWLCIGCYTCTYRCPSGISITDQLITSIREDILMQNVGVPSELQAAFERTSRYGNPFGESPRKREKWAKDAGVPVRILKEGDSTTHLWFVECFPAFHQRNQMATRDFAKILDGLNEDFGTLGRDEWCTGDGRRLGGENGLFELLYDHNSKELAKREFHEIVVTDPHAYNALVNEYPKMGSNYKVTHYTQFLMERIEKLKPLMTKDLDLKVTYHDPCYLGRRNDIYDTPRDLLNSIPGIELVEMDRNRDNALCCGGGGGGVWLDSFIWEHTEVPLPEQRVKEAARTGASVLAVACPLEVSRFEDAVKTAGLEGQLVVREISELIAESMGFS